MSILRPELISSSSSFFLPLLFFLTASKTGLVNKVTPSSPSIWRHTIHSLSRYCTPTEICFVPVAQAQVDGLLVFILSPLSDLVLHDHAFARAAHGAPSRRLDSLVAFALGAVFGVVGEVVCPAGAIVAIATRVSSRDLMLAAIFDDVACAHVAARLSAPRRKPSVDALGKVARDRLRIKNDESCDGWHV
ncbi:hypothetical protein J3F84DRAFT_384852, partial [Trichoderma pleuroticola]